MSSINILGDTSGSVLLQAPAIAGSSTVTLPTNGGTVLTTAKTGTVLQTVYASTQSQPSWTGTNIYIGLQAAITPSSTSSKILAMFTIQLSTSGVGRVQVWCTYGPNSGDNTGTQASTGIYTAYNVSSGTTGLYSVANNVQFSPSTTSQIYVKLCSTKHDGGTAYLNAVGDSTSSLVLMEIAG